MSGEGFKGRPNQATLDNIALPAKIKCLECNKNLVVARYSQNRLKKYREDIYKKGGLNAERPRCQPCMGTGSSDDLYCSTCHLYKSLEQFSKNARKNDRDNASCWGCQQRISDQEPELEDAMKETEIEEQYRLRGTSAFNLSGMGSSLSSQTKKSSNETASEAATDDSGKVWITEPLSSGGRATALREHTQPYVSTGQSRRRSNSQESSSTTSTTETWDGYGDEQKSRVAGSNASRTTDKWHKSGAVKKTAMEKVMKTVERSTQKVKNENEQRQKDSDSDDSDFEM